MAHGGREGVGQVCAGIPGISKLLPAVPDWCVQGVFLNMVLGTCKSGCGRSHHGPFGMYCPYLKLAKEQAVQLYGSEDRYREVLEAITIAEDSEEADGMGPGAAGTKPSDTDSVLQQLLVSSSENSSNLSKLCEALSGMHTTLKEIAGRSQAGRGQPPGQQSSSATEASEQRFPARTSAPLVRASHDHLAAALGTLSQPANSTPAETEKGNCYRPEFHVQHILKGFPVKNIDHTKLKFAELVHGMSLVMCDMVETEDPKLPSYIKHFAFLTGIACEGGYVTEAYVRYDRHVVDTVVRGKRHEFPVGDVLGTSRCFHATNTYVHRTAESGANRQRSRHRIRSQDPDPERAIQGSSTGAPPEWPADICYDYNMKFCQGRCSKLHACVYCRGRHKAIWCKDSQPK